VWRRGLGVDDTGLAAPDRASRSCRRQCAGDHACPLWTVHSGQAVNQSVINERRRPPRMPRMPQRRPRIPGPDKQAKRVTDLGLRWERLGFKRCKATPHSVGEHFDVWAELTVGDDREVELSGVGQRADADGDVRSEGHDRKDLE
jgi:hypothetical protein